MKMCGTWSNKAHKSDFPADFILRIFLSPEVELQCRVPMFGDLYLPNQAEPTRALIEEVVVLT